MTTGWLIGLGAAFAALMINRSIMASALRKLDDETKLKFIDVFTKRGNFSTVGMVVLVLIFSGAMQLFPQHQWILVAVYGVAVILMIVARFLISYRKLKEINVPPEYFRSFFMSYGIFILGIAVLVTSVYLGGSSY